MILRCGSTQPWHLIVASFLGGFSGGAFAPVIISLVGDLSEPSDRADSLSMWYLFSSIGMFVGPIVASMLLLFVPIRSILYLGLVMRLTMLLLTVFGIKEVRRTRSEGSSLRTSYKRDVVILLRKPNAVIAVFTRLSYTFFRSVVRTYMPILARQELNLSDPLIVSLSTFEGVARIGV